MQACWLKGPNIIFNYIWYFSLKVLKCCVYIYIRHCKTGTSETSERKAVINLHLKIPLEEYGANTTELNHLSMSGCESWLQGFPGR